MNKDDPDFIGIGASKAASTWIFRCLKEHPEICVSSKKEISFFNKRFKYKRGIRYYQSYFSHCPKDKIKGEYTPNYLFDPNAAALIHKHYPNIKLFVCLRNPVDIIYSHYRFHKKVKQRFSIYSSFEEAVKKDPILVKLGFYHEQLKRYFKLFPRENILVLFYEDIKTDPYQFVKKLYAFIGANNIDFIPSCVNKKRNVTGEIVVKPKTPYINLMIFKFRNLLERKYWLKNAFESPYVEAIIFKFLDFNKKTFKDQNKRSEKSPRILKLSIRKELMEIYHKDIDKLEQLLHKKLSSWKTI